MFLMTRVFTRAICQSIKFCAIGALGAYSIGIAEAQNVTSPATTPPPATTTLAQSTSTTAKLGTVIPELEVVTEHPDVCETPPPTWHDYYLWRSEYCKNICSNFLVGSLTENTYVPPVLFPIQARAYQTQGKGIGYRSPYSSISAFLIPYAVDLHNVQAFFDFRGHWFSKGNAAGNIGGGARWFSSCMPAVMGFNVYYDVRQFEKRQTFQQAGIGFEVLGPFCQFRMNGYLPIGKKRVHYPCRVFKYPGHFQAICQQRRTTLAGVDAEISSFLKRRGCCDIWGSEIGFGLYAYKTKCGRKMVGGKARICFQFQDYISFELRATYDSIYKGGVQGVLTFQFPFGRALTRAQRTGECSPKECFRESLRALMGLPVIRNEIIVVDKKRCQWKTNFNKSVPLQEVERLMQIEKEFLFDQFPIDSSSSSSNVHLIDERAIFEAGILLDNPNIHLDELPELTSSSSNKHHHRHRHRHRN